MIALVITVIVILILAGVVVATLTGDNGLLTKAGQARNTNIEAEGLERIQLAVMASHDDRGINTTTLAKNLSEISGLTDTNDNEILDDTEITLPKSFKLNNIKYKIKKDGLVIINNSILPDEYQQVEYIESSGTQWIDTKVNQSNYCNNLKGYMEFQFTNLDNISCVGGCRNTNSSSYFFMFLADSNQFQSNLGRGNSLEISLASSDLNKHTFLFDSSLGTCNFDGLAFNYKNTNADVPYNIYLFAYNDDNSGVLRVSSLKNYAFSLKTSQDVLIRNYMPCYRISDNVVGMYDTVEGKFYTNQGSGKFGYETEDGTYVAPQ